jgi:excisionase family DNA binding protein
MDTIGEAIEFLARAQNDRFDAYLHSKSVKVNDINEIETMIRKMKNLTFMLEYKREELIRKSKRRRDEDEIMTVEEFAKLVKLSKPTVYKLIKKGLLLATPWGDKGQLRIWRSELERYESINDPVSHPKED